MNSLTSSNYSAASWGGCVNDKVGILPLITSLIRKRQQKVAHSNLHFWIVFCKRPKIRIPDLYLFLDMQKMHIIT